MTSLWRYSNLSQPAFYGQQISGKHYPGFDPNQTHSVSAGQSCWLSINPNDFLSFQPNGDMVMAVIDADTGHDGITALLNEDAMLVKTTVQQNDFNSQSIRDRLHAVGLDFDSLNFYRFDIEPQKAQPIDRLVWQSQHSIFLIAALPETPDALLYGSASASITEFELRRDKAADLHCLPTPLGPVLDEFTISRGTAQSYQLPQGAYVQVIDMEGRQCSDFMAFNAQSLDQGIEHHIDNTVSRTFTQGAYPRPGLLNKFYDSQMVPLLEVMQDTIGRHDTFGLACTARGYEERGFPGHVNCSDNISNALQDYGVQVRPAWPAINFFFNTWILPGDNLLRSDEAWSRPGDYVLMRALTDLVCVSTACPDDIDPINGWNPTDIHVRIYADKSYIKPAQGYRVQPNDPAIMTTESPFHQQTSQLTNKYHAGRHYWVPRYYEPYGALKEYWACRENVVVQDMSNLRIVDICGIDAQALLQRVLTRDINRLDLHKGMYALICDESGVVLDDGTLFYIGANLYRWTCTTDESILHLKNIAQTEQFDVYIRDMTQVFCTLAVQGPKSAELVSKLLFIQPTQPAFEHIKWFGGCVARLHHRTGIPLYVSRTGYTGEMGYEIFCDVRDADALWEAVFAADQSVIPMGTDAVNMLRIESGLMAYGAEFGHSMEDAYEAGLGFAVGTNKTDFIGAQALARNKAAQRKVLVGLVLEGNEVAQADDPIYHQRHQVGRVSSATFSPALQRSIAMAIVNIEHATPGNTLEVGKLDGHAKRLTAQVSTIPFVDPERKRPRGL